MLGELNKSQIEQVLKSQVIGRIGIHADGKTYVVPITYVYADQYIYGHSKEGLKIQMMRERPSVCFEVDVMENMVNWQSVIAWGDYEELKTDEDKKKAMKLLVERITPLLTSETMHMHDQPNSHQMDVKGLSAVVFRIKLSELTGRFEKR